MLAINKIDDSTIEVIQNGATTRTGSVYFAYKSYRTEEDKNNVLISLVDKVTRQVLASDLIPNTTINGEPAGDDAIEKLNAFVGLGFRKGGATPPTPDPNVVDTSDGTITKDTVLTGFVGYSKGQRIVGEKDLILNQYQPNPTWWDIETIFKNDINPNKRTIYLLADSNNTVTIKNAEIGNATATYVTSDGSTYSGSDNYIHTWDKTKDKQCDKNYKTRYIIVYSSNASVAVNVSAVDCIYLYGGNNSNITILKSWNTSNALSNRMLECIKFDSSVIGSSTTIGTDAFMYCYTLVSITIPNLVTSIGNTAFRECHSLSSIIIPNSVTSIGGSAFYYCYSLISVKLSDSITSLNGVFSNCYSLKSLTIPNSVTNLGGGFDGLFSLTDIIIPNSITSMPAVQYCYSLKSITIPNSVTSISSSFLYNATSLESVVIQQGYILPSNLNLSYSKYLSISFLEDFANKLGATATTRTITIGAVNKVKLSTEILALFTSKNYTIA